MRVEVEQEDDGRWIAEVPVVPGAMVYGSTRDEAVMRVQALVLRTLADKIEHAEVAPELLNHVFTVARESLPREVVVTRPGEGILTQPCISDQKKRRRRFEALAGSCPDLPDVPAHMAKDLRRDER